LCAEINAATVDYDIDSWSLSDGLPHEWVRCFQQTDDGYMWVATRGGLARFDGKTIKAFTRANTPSAFHLNDNCLSLAKDRFDGSLWIGTREGVVNFKNSQFKQIRWHDARNNNPDVWALSASHAGGVWAAHGDGLTRITPDHQIKHYDVPGYSRRDEWVKGLASVIEDRQARLFIANEDGICLLNSTNGKWQPLTDPSAGNHRSANNLIETRDGSIYWTTSTGLGRFFTNRVYFYPPPPEVSFAWTNLVHAKRNLPGRAESRR
jgi:ligand-binding sensor domain-containing protein